MTAGFMPPGAWGVLWLFTVPFGGGIPAGVLLARTRGLGWPAMLVLYFISDLLLAVTFEPMLKLLAAAGRRIRRLALLADAMRHAMRKTTENYGSASGPLALVLIAFGVDPMTGRAAAHAAGHGFVSGWAIAITGDMMYFTVIMASTLWLSRYLGDGTMTMGVILVLMIVAPMLIKKWRERKAR